MKRRKKERVKWKRSDLRIPNTNNSIFAGTDNGGVEGSPNGSIYPSLRTLNEKHRFPGL